MTIFSDLISNVALLLALSILYSFLTRIWKHEEIPGRILGGFLFGLVAVAGMINPFNYEPGVIFDARSMVVSMAGLFGGPLTAAISTLIAGTYRLWLGGTGALTGFGVIFTSAALGVGYYYLRQRRPEVIGSLYLFVFGIIVHLFMLLWMLTLPWPLAFHVLAKISLPVMLIFPLGTLFLGTLLLDQEKRNYAQDQLAESEKRYRRIVETANEGIWVIDAQFKTTSVNRVMAEMLGYVEDEMLGRIITDFMVEDELADQSLRMAKRQKGESETYERTYRKKDGSSVWCMVSASPLVNEKGDFTGSFAMLTDITDRKRTEEALRKSESQYRDLVQNANSAIIRYQADGIITFFNEYAQRFFGYSPEEVIGKHVGILVPEQESSGTDLTGLVQDIIENPNLYINNINENICRDGRLVWMNWTNRAILDQNGQVAEILAVGSDITEKKRSEEALGKSEKRFISLYNAMTEGVCLHELVYNESGEEVDYRIIDANPSYENILGLKKKDVLNQSGSIIYEAEPPPYLSIYAKVARTGEPVQFETFFAPMKKHFLVSVFSPERDQFATIFQDITERKQVEEALKENKNFIDKIINTAPNLVYIYDLVEKRNVYSNNGIKKLLGFGVGEIQKMGEKFFPELLHPDDLDKVLVHQELLEKSTEGEVFEIDYRIKDSQGRYRILRSWDTGFKRGEDDKVQQVIGLAVDVTEQIRAEESLKFEKERAQQYLDVAGVILIAIDTDRKVTLINPKGCEILGYPKEEIIGKDWFDHFLFSENVNEVKGVFDQILSGNIELVRYYENPVKTRVGDNRLVAWHNSLLKDSQENIIGLFSSGEDITEQKRVEAEQERLRSQLTQSQKMEAIGTLAGGIAHDFNNILGIILGNAELAMDDVPDLNPARNNLDEVRKACLRAKDVVSQILAFSRKSESEQNPFNIASVVTESLKLLRASIPTSVDIRRNISNDIEDILGDPTQIHQIMINLCTNAAHAMEDAGGTLEVVLENTELDEDTAYRHPELKPGPYVQLSVSDTGFGMSPEVMGRIFDPYFTTKDVGKGTGLGLSVVHGIVNSHRGGISVESEAGKGTTFNLLFPAVERQMPQKPKKLEELPTGEERILFVDDEDAMVSLNRQRLERLGYKVVSKTDPSEALAFFRYNPHQIDLVITDMTMPRMTGDKLAQEILNIRSDIPIIICTGYSQKMTAEKAREFGIRKYIEKPIEMGTLARSVREVLDDNRSTTQFSES